MEMAYKYREELVGKRFLSVSGVSKLNVSKISEWGWKAGVIRAASHKDNKNKELQVLVEYDGEGWRRRQWISVYGGSFGAFLVEKEVTWAPRGPKGAHKFPALTFIALKSVTLGPKKPVEFLGDHELSFVEESELELFEDWECGGEAGLAARRWARRQQAQRVLARCPATLGGCRAQVYRARGATQWYTAVIVGCNQETGELTLTDDTVLEEHNEDPALVQMRLLGGDVVIESIMRGDTVGITPRRSRSGTLQAKKDDQSRVSNRSVARAKKAGALLPAVEENEKGPKKTAKKRPTFVAKLKSKVKKVLVSRAPKKEDIENKNKKKSEGSFSKKKILEEVNNSKLREPEKVPEESFLESNLEGDSSNVSSVVSVQLQAQVSVPPESVALERQQQEQEGEQRPQQRGEQQPPAATGALEDAARMDEAGRFPDDRSDSGVSSLRSASGDERSGSRSSALSVPEEHEPGRGMAHPAAAAPAPAGPRAPHLPHLPHLQHQLPHLHYPPPLLHLPPPELYAPPDLLWNKRYQDEYLDRERHERHERLLRSQQYLRAAPYTEADLVMAAGQPSQRHLAWHRERREQEVRELENQQMKERERMEKDRERERAEREQQERERQEKAVHKHFEDSLRLANQKRDRTMSWNLINSLVPPGRGAPNPSAPAHQPGPDDHRGAPNSDRLRGGQDIRERSYYSQAPIQRPPSVPSKNDYPHPPPAHNRLSLNPKPLEKPQVHVSLPKGEPNFNMYNYTGYHHPSGFINHDSKQKSEHLKQVQMHGNITVTKAPSIPQERDRDNSLPTPPPLMSEMKNSVIVKHDGKLPQHHIEVKAHPAHSPKLRAADMAAHYLPVTQAPPNSYRGAPAPQRGRPSAHHAPARPPMPYSYHPAHAAPPQVPSKPKVSSPAPPHIYGKPNAGITSGIPVCRSQEPPAAVNAIPLTSKVNSALCGYSVARPPPPAHSRGEPRLLLPHGASPPAAHPAPQPHSYQTQPLDLGISSDRDDSDRSPKRRGTPIQSLSDSSGDNKKRRLESTGPPFLMESIQQYPPANTSPLLSRVSEPTPLIASAATTITTMVNTAAYCTSPAPRTQTDSPVRIPSADGAVRPPSVPGAMEVPASVAPCPSPLPPVTPVKVPSPPAAGSPKESGAPVRHLKKAWLQRHETAPEPEKEPAPAPLPVTAPLVAPAIPYSIGSSMAVNSIIRTKPVKVARKSLKETNGHVEDHRKIEDSSSSDQERGTKSPPKRKPPKVKRKKGGGPRKSIVEEVKKKKNSAVSESGSDSEKESDKDSDSGASLNHSLAAKRTANGGNSTPKETKEKEPRKRGRRPKTSKGDKNTDDEPVRNKKSKDEPPNPPFRKPPISQLKKSGDSFLQDGACCDVAPKLAKCRECRWTPHQRSKNMPNIFCRFYAFRRLRYTKNGQLAIAGFSDPNTDPTEEDRKLWLQASGDTELDIEMSCFLLRQVGDQFCDLLQQENEAKSHNLNEDKTIAWKRVVQGVREMCDVCETTLFNFHWACGKCGFVVCLDCYKSRTGGAAPSVPSAAGAAARERDAHGWLACTSRAPHEPARLLLTQIAAGDALTRTGRRLHSARALWSVPRGCECSPGTPPAPALARACRRMLKDVVLGNIKKTTEDGKEKTESLSNGSPKNGNTAISWLADVALKKEDKGNDDTSSSDSEAEGNFSTLRELLIRPNRPSSGNASPTSTNGTARASKKSRLDILDDVISSVIENKSEDKDNDMDVKPFELKHFVRRYHRSNASGRDQLPIRIMTNIESSSLYPDTPHSWLCDGKLLRLLDPTHPGNYRIFQDQWKRGQPVIVSDVLKLMNKDLWSPESFSHDFGEEKNDLINCITGNIVPNQPMKKFWDGFEQTTKRLKDERGEAMLLKLKDWPPGEDFAEMLPTRFTDLMKALPLQEYTHRTGRLNLASRLPDCFVRPDLGPKMYTAYGSALHPGHGTTNLHLDVSDAVNVMVYVSGPKDAGERATREAFRAIDEAGCDILTRRRVRERGELPGALWHIYSPRDADKIRDLLNKTAIEKGAHPLPHHDPIHDQSCYLDAALRERLYKEYRVEGYAVAQCLGDAVFIPAGAPHQVRNLHDCIKVAEDFVSPENVSHCFHLTQEFRDLTDTHTNHEDKLQIKNIIYHAVKDSLDCLKKAAATAEGLADPVISKDDIKKEMLP